MHRCKQRRPQLANARRLHPNTLDLARLLSPDEFARRGMGDLTSIITGIQRAHLSTSEAMTRLALWGASRKHFGDRVG
ncbi:MAG: hypothetical protein ACRENP_18640 [Longimicrobiales bacterium]